VNHGLSARPDEYLVVAQALARSPVRSGQVQKDGATP